MFVIFVKMHFVRRLWFAVQVNLSPVPHSPTFLESNALPGEAKTAAGMKKVEKAIAKEVKKMQKDDLDALKFLAEHGPKCEESKQPCSREQSPPDFCWFLFVLGSEGR